MMLMQAELCNEMIPYFIEDDYFGGVNAAVDAMIARLSVNILQKMKVKEVVFCFILNYWYDLLI